MIMTLTASPLPLDREPNRWSRQLVGWLCVAALIVVGLSYAVPNVIYSGAMSDAQQYDYDFSGDPRVIQDVEVPAAFQEVGDTAECTAASYLRCFVTSLDRRGVLAYLHATVGTAATADGAQRGMPGWTACGDIAGTPAIAFIRRHATNAINVGLGSWKTPRFGPSYDGSLVVGMMLVNAPHCT
jgi:hypothetical protein